MSLVRTLSWLTQPAILAESRILTGACSLIGQTRNTYIVKRKWEPPLSKLEGKTRKLQSRHYIYELVEETSWNKQNDLTLIMTDDVEGIGSKGQVVNVRPYIGRHLLLAANKAIYASPENMTKLKEDMAKGIVRSAPKNSSPWAPKTARELSTFILQVYMNMEEPWTLEPWHLRVAFRTANFVVPDEAITMPIHPISGPDANVENKEFLIKVTINSREEAHVRCRIHHWTDDPDKAFPLPSDHWKYSAEPLFPEEANLLETLPKPDYLLPQRLSPT